MKHPNPTLWGVTKKKHKVGRKFWKENLKLYLHVDPIHEINWVVIKLKSHMNVWNEGEEKKPLIWLYKLMAFHLQSFPALNQTIK
jgi:hypothetical protein